MTNPIYTLGLHRITSDVLLDFVRRFRIDCVVDIRNISMASIPDEFEANRLKALLRSHGKYYLAFIEEFGHPYPFCYNRHGKLLYDKMLAEPNVQKGLQRLCNGMENYCILVIDEKYTPTDSIRYSVIGRFLTERGYKVVHIFSNGHFFSHDEMAQMEMQKAIRKKEKKKQAIELGVCGEEIAALYLMRQGFTILDRNWNLHHGCELDIVALKDNTLHFVEVKTRSSTKYGEPQTAINRKKIVNIQRAAFKYRNWKRLRSMEYMIDSIAVVYRSEDDYDVNFYTNLCLW